MTLELHGFAQSTCVKRVQITLQELDVPYKFVTVDWAKGETKTPEWLEKQPFGQVPYLVDGEFILFESRAIARYIAAKYQKPGGKVLLPSVSDVERWAKFEQAASIEVADFDPYVSGYNIEKIFKPAVGVAGDDTVASTHFENMSKKLDGYERILTKTKWLAGDEITLADLFHLPHATLLPQDDTNPLLDPKRPHVFNWWKELTALPSWQAVRWDATSTTH